LENTRFSSQAPSVGEDAVGVLAGAGDIAVCGAGSAGAISTARLLDQIPGTVFTAGDNAYATGTAKDFHNCYDPTWGRHRARTRPSPGNHEYESGGSAYFDYFGSNAGPPGLGYYSYTVGSWRVFSLNSEAPSGPGSAQGEWLRNELSGDRSACTMAYWHRPLFSSGKIGDNPDMRDLWRMLYAAGVDVVINGHDHLYERFAPQDPDGRPDPAHGIREFIVGTGGAPISGIARLHSNSEANATMWGVAVFTLYDHSYQWRFVPSTEEFEDSGSSACH
jgi:acid phosphatase type 7